MNGVLNCSILDGWWPEACQHGVNGWAIGEGSQASDPTGTMDMAELDAQDADDLYSVLLDTVLPTYYERPDDWESMMNASIDTTEERFAVKRMLDDYFRLLYTA